MRVIFLDYDGVVNTPMWKKNHNNKWICSFACAGETVNNPQAVQWLSEICEKFDYKNIVVTSTWRMWENFRESLIGAGLRDGIKIIGSTKITHGERGDEIEDYLKSHPEIDEYLIFDDEMVAVNNKQKSRLIQTDTAIGITEREFEKVERLLKNG